MKGNRVSNWRDLIDPVRDKLSIVLELWDTGGGCTALQAFLEGDVTVVVTDSPSSRRGQEAHITSATRRRELGEKNVGFYIIAWLDRQLKKLSVQNLNTGKKGK